MKPYKVLQPYLIKLHFMGLQFNQIYRQKTVDRARSRSIIARAQGFLRY